ncbi:MAG: radical SAM protein [Pseudomonadota bacterium]
MTAVPPTSPGNILLVQPKASEEAAYPLGLAQVAAVLKAEGASVIGADLHFDRPREMVALARAARVRWVGASVLAHTAAQVGALFRRLRLATGCGLFVQGAWPTLEPATALAQTCADVAIRGDPERTVARLIRAGVPDRPFEGVALAHPGAPLLGDPAARVPLASLPLPDREVFPVLRYSFAMRATATPYAAVFTSRGCGRVCPWCGVSAIRPTGFDGRAPEAVAEELAALARDHGVASVLVEDDHFLEAPDRVRALCALLIARRLPLALELVNGVRPEAAEPELFGLLARAGVARVVFGFEQLHAQAGASPGCDMPTARRAVAIARGAGLRVGGYFIAGLPGVPVSTVLRGAALARELDLDDANFVPFYPAPGSAWAGEPPGAAGAGWLARAAQALFFSRPRSVTTLSRDLIREPRALGAMAKKALELVYEAGPVPVRDNP